MGFMPGLNMNDTDVQVTSTLFDLLNEDGHMEIDDSYISETD